MQKFSKPNSNIKPSEVVKIQLSGLQKNDLDFKDSGIEQNLEFCAPPTIKKGYRSFA